MSQVEENTRRINGIAKSLDTVKGRVDSIQSQIGEVKGIALSADRGFHILTDRQQLLKEAQDKMYSRIEHIGDSINGLYKQNFKYFMATLSFILTLAGFGFAIYKMFGE